LVGIPSICWLEFHPVSGGCSYLKEIVNWNNHIIFEKCAGGLERKNSVWEKQNMLLSIC